jgi:hypothetical protein
MVVPIILPQKEKTNTVQFHLYKVLRIVKIIGTESRMVATWERNGELLLIGVEFQFYKMKVVMTMMIVMGTQHYEST